MRILVIGATGKTGRHLVNSLTQRGVVVRAAARRPAISSLGVEPVVFDWADRSTWEAATRGVDGAYLIGPFQEDGGEGLVDELLAFAPHIRRVVLLSVIGAEQAPEGLPIHVWEDSVRRSGREWTILRPNWFHQNFSENFYLPALAERGELLAPTGEATVSFVDCRDIAEVAAVALTGSGHEERTYTLTGPEAMTFAAVADTFGSVTSRPVRHVDSTPEQMAGYLRSLEVPDFITGWVLGLFDLIRKGANAPVTDTVEKVTGRPARPFAAYAHEERRAWQGAVG